MSKTLLLTGTISPSQKILNQGYSSLSLNPNNRYFEYINAIIYYISQSNFNCIVFCENSNYNFKDLDFINQLCKIYNKQFELLQFEGNHDKTLEIGYGYGDAECIDYAVNNSKLLQNSENWYKISGRYICVNINEIIERHIHQNNLFFKGVNYSFFSTCTALYKTNNTFYKEYLYNKGNKVNKNHSLEYVYYNELRIFLLNNTCGYLKIFPIFSKGNNMIKITFPLKILFKIGLCNIGSKISFILDKILYKYE